MGGGQPSLCALGPLWDRRRAGCVGLAGGRAAAHGLLAAGLSCSGSGGGYRSLAGRRGMKSVAAVSSRARVGSGKRP